jgi:hypothetical protein
MNTPRFERLHPAFRFSGQFIKEAELNGFRRTGFCTGRLESGPLPVGTKGALESPPIIYIALDHSKGTTHNAIRATIANIGLNVNGAKLHAHDRASGARFKTPRNFAMLTNIGRK